MFFTITFRSFTPTPGGLEFTPGKDYYFISASNTRDIHRRVGWWCSSHNMKMVFKVEENAVTERPQYLKSDSYLNPQLFEYAKTSEFKKHILERLIKKYEIESNHISQIKYHERQERNLKNHEDNSSESSASSTFLSFFIIISICITIHSV